MQKNWYLIYTKPKCEKKVAYLLTKRKIENFCPLNSKKLGNARKSKTIYKPLFDSYVFVFIEEDAIPLLKQIEGVVNLVYWKGEPAVIKEEEVTTIKDFTSVYIDIKLEKNAINHHGDLRTVDKQPSYRRDGNLLKIENRSSKVYLPSMGFTMIADIEAGMGRSVEIAFGSKELNLQS
jgi:transcription antitermination factor NusG